MHNLEQQFIAAVRRVHFHSEVAQDIDDFFAKWLGKDVDFALGINRYFFGFEVLQQLFHLAVVAINYGYFFGRRAFLNQPADLHSHINHFLAGVFIFADSWLNNQFIKTRVRRTQIFIKR